MTTAVNLSSFGDIFEIHNRKLRVRYGLHHNAQ